MVIQYDVRISQKIWQCIAQKVNNTWPLVEFPHDKKAIDVKWVYKVKLKPKGEVTRHKERLVAKGFLQIEGIYFDEVFAHVARIETI